MSEATIVARRRSHPHRQPCPPSNPLPPSFPPNCAPHPLLDTIVPLAPPPVTLLFMPSLPSPSMRILVRNSKILPSSKLCIEPLVACRSQLS
ncbi:hypothetical protein LZ31DRAFT_82634 [Colletotrichum somersetense]|nr:hypothetical protein LZ31DRAFT_82634 [Colletotrichum somersetense]